MYANKTSIKDVCAVMTKGGFLALWEKGGCNSDHSKCCSTIITKADGSEPSATYIPHNREACGEHALIVIHEGYYVIETELKPHGFEISVYQAVALNVLDNKHQKNPTITLKRVNRYSINGWEQPVERHLNDAIIAAMFKCVSLECRSVSYAHGKN